MLEGESRAEQGLQTGAEAGTERTAASWLASHGLLTQDHMPRNGATHSALGPPKSGIYQEKSMTSQSGQDFSHFFFFSQPNIKTNQDRFQHMKGNKGYKYMNLDPLFSSPLIKELY